MGPDQKQVDMADGVADPVADGGCMNKIAKEPAMNQVTPLHEAQLPAVMDSSAFMAGIIRAASDPACDVMKMERLAAMVMQMQQRESERAYADAMNAAQAEMRAISQDASNPQTRSKYASYAALDSAIRPIYAKHGFALSFDTADGAPENCVRVVCKVSHKMGHSERPHLDMPNDGKGAKGGDVMTKTHATMSAVSYARRGLLKMVWNLSEGEHDDDGNGAATRDDYRPSGNITPEQVAALHKIITDNGFDMAVFLNWAKVENLNQIPAASFAKAMNALHAKVQAKSAPK